VGRAAKTATTQTATSTFVVAIENRLTGQQLSMIARRYMRDLHNSATIEFR